jgi:hypothetical protein
MLPIIVLLLVIGYIILDRSGMLEDIAGSLQKQGHGHPPRHPEMDNGLAPDEDADRRLEVFEDFIEGLENSKDEEE